MPASEIYEKLFTMRKYLFAMPICFIVFLSATHSPRTMTGKWNVAYANKIGGVMVFQRDGHFEATFTGQTWKVGGQYKLDGTTVSVQDSTCGFGYWGKYSATWYSDDSVKLVAVEDSCSGRKMNGDGMVLVRAKK
jgi:hypothetical protein